MPQPALLTYPCLASRAGPSLITPASASQLCEGLCDVEIAQRTDLKEGHTQAHSLGLSLLSGHEPLECQVQTVPHQDLGDTSSVPEVER